MMASPLPLAFVIAAIIVLGVTGNLFSLSPLVIAVQVAAVALNVWARVSFESGTFRVSAAPSDGAIMTHGPYRYLRHPMYSAVLVFVWAGVLSHLSILSVAIGVAVTAVAVVRTIVEERLLRTQYPDYAAYAETTKALVPFVY